MRSSTRGMTLPAVPKRTLPTALPVRTGEVSVSPYPGMTLRPTAWKNSAMSLERGAPPQMKYRIRPPVLAVILEKTSFFAKACLKARWAGTGSPAIFLATYFFPVARPQTKIARLRREPARTWSMTRA